MAQKIKSALSRRISGLRRELWKLGIVPYNTAVILIAGAIMIQSQAWKLREP